VFINDKYDNLYYISHISYQLYFRRLTVATYLIEFSLTEMGLKGLMKEGGTKRRDVIEGLVKSLGGRLVAYYYAFGDYDGFAIIEGEGNVNTAAGNLIVAASGAAKTRTTVLLTAEEIDQATKITGAYRAPGQ
jgi:uncharacterized protein with GYD domain